MVVYYLYQTIFSDPKSFADFTLIVDNIFKTSNKWPIIVLILLVPVNWAFESLKWQVLVQRVTPISFLESNKGILSGLAVGVAVPAQLGDTIGRVAALKTSNRLEAIGASIVSNGIQFYISVLVGIAGWHYWHKQLALSEKTEFWMEMSFGILVTLGLTLFLCRHYLLLWKPKKSIGIKIRSYFKVIAYYNAKELILATTYGILRYTVFIVQYILIFSLLSYTLDPLTLAASVSLILLAKTVIPAVNAIGDLGLRGFTAIFVLSPFHLPAEEIIAATFIIWIINIVCPILIGIVLIWKTKLKLKYD
jgi:hypothetical protein